MPISTHSEVTAGAVMHHGVINAPPQSSLQEVAALMAHHRVHSVVVEGLAEDQHHRERLVWGIVSDLDLIRAMASGRTDISAGELAATEIVTVAKAERIGEVARLMAEHDCGHLVVISTETSEPIGVISSLDVAGVLGRITSAQHAGARTS